MCVNSIVNTEEHFQCEIRTQENRSKQLDSETRVPSSKACATQKRTKKGAIDTCSRKNYNNNKHMRKIRSYMISFENKKMRKKDSSGNNR